VGEIPAAALKEVLLMFKMVLSNADLIKNSIPIIAEIIDEGVFKINQNGLSLLSPDRTMVAVVDFHIPSAAFDEFKVEGDVELGMNLSSLVDVVKRIKGSDKVIIQSGKENKVNIIVEGNGKRKFELSLLDIQTEKPPVDQLKFSCKIDLSSQVLDEGIADADIVADSVVFHASPGIFKMTTKGEMSSTELEMKKGEDGLNLIEASDSIKARYPLEYLKKMIKASKLADNVVLEFGSDYPMKILFRAVDKISLGFILAPRVED
jgi:proliferating cell nuclear antigen